MPIQSKTILKTSEGSFVVRFHEIENKGYISFSKGDLSQEIPIVRLQSGCLFGEAFGSLECDCGQQLKAALQTINAHTNGVVVYSYTEGRGVGLEKKIEAMEIQRTEGCDSREAFVRLGFDRDDYRDYRAEIEVLRELMVPMDVILLSENKKRRAALERAGFTLHPHE